MFAPIRRWILTGFAFVALATLSSPMLQAQDAQLATADTDDDEIVVIGQDGKVYGLVYSQAPGKDPELLVGFSSPDAGWTNVATGDFNGDGDDEIVATGGTLVKVFDPGGSATPASFTTAGDSPNPWTQVATGDVNNDGRDEIILLRAEGSGGNVTIYSPTNSTATTWVKRDDVDFLTNWRDVAVGDIEGNGKADLVLIYYQNPNHLLELREGDGPEDLVKDDQDASSFATDQEWFDVVAGQIQAGGRTEWVGTRSKSNSALVQYWTGSQITTLNSANFSPAFSKLAVGDIYGDGDEEVVGLRNVNSGTGVQVWNPAGTQYTFVLGEAIGTGWLGLAVGNVDKEVSTETKPYHEIILVKPNLIRIYTVAQANNTFQDFSGSYLGPVAVGNLNIVGQKPFELSETSITRFEAIGAPTIQSEDFTVDGESAPGTPYKWQMTVIPTYSWSALQAALAADPNLEVNITDTGLTYSSSSLGAQSVPAVDWLQLLYNGQTAVNGSSITGSTPATVTADFIEGKLNNVNTYEATILIDLGPNVEDRFKTIDVTAIMVNQVFRTRVPLILR